MFDDNLFDKAFNLFSRVQQQDFEYVYRGYFTHNITKKILTLADINIQKAVPFSTIQKRIYYIMVEGLQNISRHQDEIEDANEEYPGIFAIQKQKDRYYVTTGNLVLNDKIPGLKEKINKINSLEKDELKKFHKEILRSGAISDKGGAGLGLIEMARKSDNKLISSFELINENYSYFYLQTQIPTTKENELENEVQELKLRKFLISIKKLHLSLIIENILLYFNGFFNQENLLSLLSIVKGRLNMSITTIRLSNVMVEMIQNIIKHGANDEVENGKPGIFFVQQKENGDFVLTSGNYVKESDAKSLEEKILEVNALSKEDLNEYYDKILLDLDSVTSKKSGLGLPDLRIKSGQKLVYNFHKLKEDLYFYILQTTVINKKR
ncbi:MAG: SiaB family protein kinase [Bacteroidales bacterium]|nr:SiaB family protein kinase [Bacteroidales bacterium]